MGLTYGEMQRLVEGILVSLSIEDVHYELDPARGKDPHKIGKPE